MSGLKRFAENVIAVLAIAFSVLGVPAQAEEPFLVKDIWTGPENSYLTQLYAVDDLAFFHATDGTDGFELYRSDGNTLGTFRIMDLRPGSTGSNPSTFGNLSGLLLFTASDGTEAGTTIAYNFNTSGSGYPALFTQIGDLLLFSAGDVDHGYELWGLSLCLFCDDFEMGGTQAWTISMP